MSIVIKFFVAPDETTAAAMVDGGPDETVESLDFGNFDAAGAMIEWESIFTSRSFEELVTAGEPRVVAAPGEEGGSVVLVASGLLQDALAGAEQSRLVEVAGLWIQERVEEGEVFDPEMVDGLLGDLAGLARIAGGRGHSLYCWMAYDFRRPSPGKITCPRSVHVSAQARSRKCCSRSALAPRKSSARREAGVPSFSYG